MLVQHRLFSKYRYFLAKNDVQWNNCTSLGLDNTDANIGNRNSIKTKDLEKNPTIKISGYPCYVIHNAATKASTAFAKITKFDIEDRYVYLHDCFGKSSTRKSALEVYYVFCDTEYTEVIRYASTSWLCLERCVNRELQKYVALESYFKAKRLSDVRFKRLEAAFNNSLAELYLLFYQAVIPVFTTFNKMLQSEEPLIYFLYKCQKSFMNKPALKFVKPDITRTLKETYIKSQSSMIENKLW